MMTIPSMFRVTLAGGPGCINVMFLLLGIVCMDRIDRTAHRVLAVVFLSLANLTRPDSWPSTYLIIFLVLTLKLSGREGHRLNRADWLLLIPLGMPLVWLFLDWVVFGDPLYSINIVGAFGAEYLGGYKPRKIPAPKEAAALIPREVIRFLPRVKSAFFDLFSVSGWFSLRAAVLVVLLVSGIGTMYRKQPRNLLLIACPIVGTLLFYFVYAFRGILFRIAYIYSAYVCVTLIVSLGLASLCSLAGSVRPRLAGRFLQVALAIAVLLFLTVRPFQYKTMDETIPLLKGRAAVSKLAKPAIDSLVEHVKGTGGNPIILTSGLVPASRIALGLSTGKDTFCLERLISRKMLGMEMILPDFKGRAVYFCIRRPMHPNMKKFVRLLMKDAARKEVIYDRDRIVIEKCFY
jgi:hypothetical protein